MVGSCAIVGHSYFQLNIVFIVRCQETRVRVFGRLPKWLRKLGGFPEECFLNTDLNSEGSPSQLLELILNYSNLSIL